MAQPKVYYLAAYQDSNNCERFVTPTKGGLPDRSLAERFNFLHEAVDGLSDHMGGIGWKVKLIRVEETPGVEQRVVLGETEAAPEGAVVRYALKYVLSASNDPWIRDLSNSWHNADQRYTNTLNKAKLFDTIAQAAQHVVDDASGCQSLKTCDILRIAVLPGTPTITETILA